MRRLLKVLFATILGIVCLLLLLSIVAPIVGRKYIVNHSEELIGRKVLIDDIGLNLFNGSLSIDEFHIKECESDSDFVSFAELKVQVRLLDLLRKRVTVNKIYLTNADVNVYQQDNIFNFSDIINRFSVSDTIQDNIGENVDSTSSALIISLNDIRLKECKIRYRDLTVGSDFGLNNINLEIPALSFGGEKSSGGVQLNFEHGGFLLTDFKYAMETSDFDLYLKLSHFNLSDVLPYLKPFINVSAINGEFNTDLNLNGNLNYPLMTKVSGSVSVDSFALLTEYDEKPILSLDHFGAELTHTAIDSGFIHLRTVSLNNLYSNVSVDKNGQINVMDLIVSQEVDTSSVLVDQAADSSTTALPPMRIVIDDINFTNLNVNYSDASLPERFDYTVGRVNILAKNFATDCTNSIDISGKIGLTGNLNCKWTGSVDDLKDMQLLLSLSNLNLKEFSPYCKKMFAYDIVGGNISFNSENNIVNGYLKGENDLDVFKCNLEKDHNFKDADYNIPMKTGLYIITDRNDHIKIDLPVKGNVNSPEFSYKKIIIKTFINLIVKVVASPFTSIGDAMGLGGKDYSKMDFDAFSVDFLPEQYQTLNEIADMIHSKPNLTLEITQRINYTSEIEKTALFILKKEYFLKLHPEKKLDEIHLIDEIEISSIPVTEAGFVSFADSLNSEEKSMSDKALLLYHDVSLSEVESKSMNRQNLLYEYLIERKGLKPEQLKITTTPSNQDIKYSGSTCLEFNAVGSESQPE